MKEDRVDTSEQAPTTSQQPPASPKFSIIVPIYNVAYYNGENLFTKCMQSILAQTYRNIEVVLVDDGSTDDASQQCDAYAKADPRVVVIHKANGGLSSARNMGLRRATGEYIVFVDADDELNTRSCEVFAKIILQYPNIDIISSDVMVLKKGRISYMMKFTSTQNGSVENGVDYLKLQLRNRSLHPVAVSHIVRRDYLLDNMLFFSEDIFVNEDTQWTSLLFLPAKKVISSGFVHYYYLLLDNSLSNPQSNKERFMGTLSYCYDLERQFLLITDTELRTLLMAYICNLWLYAFRKGGFYKKRYKHIIHKDFVAGKAIHYKDKIWVFIFRISPVLYYYIFNVYSRLRELMKGQF